MAASHFKEAAPKRAGRRHSPRDDGSKGGCGGGRTKGRKRSASRIVSTVLLVVGIALISPSPAGMYGCMPSGSTTSRT
ncbi:MAG: hypothetical protein LKF13_04730 [Atopobiaceae bacterium]|jgi:hypothetical protein|nr:hypothetical protein [Atopobiaceae bacterium]